VGIRQPGAFRVAGQGFVSRHPLPAGPRTAVAPDGSILCSYVGRSGAGTSDYALLLARSADGGATWRELGPVWPEDAGRVSVTASVRAAPDGDLFLFGALTRIDDPAASWWDPERGAMAANDLFWSRSQDGGRSWSARRTIPMPFPAAAEAPGPMLVTRSGRWLACYAPYPTFDRGLEVDRRQVVVVWSDDAGDTWHGTSMLRFPEPDAGAAEAWLVELTDGRLLGTCWRMDLRTGLDAPIPFAMSHDGGQTWGPTRSTGVGGQATGLAALPDGRAAMVFNQRDPGIGPVGVWLALLRPGADGALEVEANAPVWQASTARSPEGADTGHDAWQSFSFGEPGVTHLTDGELLVTIWSGQHDAAGVVWVRVRLEG
jgi:hypothetical protein